MNSFPAHFQDMWSQYFLEIRNRNCIKQSYEMTKPLNSTSQTDVDKNEKSSIQDKEEQQSEQMETLSLESCLRKTTKLRTQMNRKRKTDPQQPIVDTLIQRVACLTQTTKPRPLLRYRFCRRVDGRPEVRIVGGMRNDKPEVLIRRLPPTVAENYRRLLRLELGDFLPGSFQPIAGLSLQQSPC